jgi:beta-lactamase class A
MKKTYSGVLLLFLAIFCAVPVFAGSLSTVSVESQILPMEDGSGNYMLKSDGFYCLDVNGTVCTKEEIHYFDHFEIDGTVFDGYYYHGTDGCFLASFSHIVQMNNLKAVIGEASAEGDTETVTEQTFNGYFMVGNLGRMTSAPQVRYLSNLQLGTTVLDGFYYFNENGQLVTDPGTYYVSMNCNGRAFDGYYYFGGANGAPFCRRG